jgi:hypothetical protein
MKFLVKLVNEAKLGRFVDGTPPPDLINRTSFRYELSGKVELNQHLSNIHKSLCTSGINLQDPPASFLLRVKPLFDTDHYEFPMYLNPFQLPSQISRLADLTKILKKKGYLIEFILTREILAQRFLEHLNAIQSTSDGGKELLFNLRAQLHEIRFTEEFLVVRGLDALFQVLPLLKGYTTIGYAISAIAVTLKSCPKSVQGKNETPNCLAVEQILRLYSRNKPTFKVECAFPIVGKRLYSCVQSSRRDS